MSFVSFEFGLFMLLTVGAYFCVPKKWQWICLLAASAIFYAASGITGLIFPAMATVIVYVAALLIEKQNTALTAQLKNADAAQKKLLKAVCVRKKRLIVTVAVVLCVGTLVTVKYNDFFFGNINLLLSLTGTGMQLAVPDLIKPLGISYFTLQAIGYLIEVYRGKTKAERSLPRFALFISYFPQIIQGPLTKYQDLTKTLYEPHAWDYDRVRSGALRVLWGYFKKLLIATRIGVVFNHVLGIHHDPVSDGIVIFLTFILYGFQVYADFSGGIDITLGISEIFGIQVAENFRRPFFARSVAEFWQRWHMTLGAWMRNYVFYPLALSKPFSALGKKIRGVWGAHAAKIIPTSLASFVVFVLVGVWHGTGFKYVAYGLYHAIFVSTATLLEPLYARCRSRLHIREESKPFVLMQMLRTLLLVTVGRYLSAANSLRAAVRMYRVTFTGDWSFAFLVDWIDIFGLAAPDMYCLLIALAVIFVVDVINEKGICIRSRVLQMPLPLRWAFYLIALYAVIIFGAYGEGFDASAFIYERF